MLFIRNEREKKIMKQRSFNLLLITVILTLCALFSGCTYSNSETNDNKNSVSQPTTIARKSYTEEEFVSLYKHNKFPKSYLMKIGDGNYFSFQHYDDNNNINIVTATFKKATKYTNISKLDKKNFSNYAEDIAPYVDKKGNLKTYKRTTKKIINGGLDEKLISVNNKAQRELVIVDVELKNKSNIKVDSTLTLQLSFNRYKSLDDEFVTDELYNYEFTDEKDNLAFDESNIYITKSKYKNVKNVNKRMMNFYSYTLKPNETLKCQVGFIIDKDLEDAMIISPTTGTPLELQVFK